MRRQAAMRGGGLGEGVGVLGYRTNRGKARTLEPYKIPGLSI